MARHGHKTIVIWTARETRDVALAAAYARQANPKLKPAQAMIQSQSILPESRRRTENSISSTRSTWGTALELCEGFVQERTRLEQELTAANAAVAEADKRVAKAQAQAAAQPLNSPGYFENSNQGPNESGSRGHQPSLVEMLGNALETSLAGLFERSMARAITSLSQAAALNAAYGTQPVPEPGPQPEPPAPKPAAKKAPPKGAEITPETLTVKRTYAKRGTGAKAMAKKAAEAAEAAKPLWQRQSKEWSPGPVPIPAAKKATLHILKHDPQPPTSPRPDKLRVFVFGLLDQQNRELEAKYSDALDIRALTKDAGDNEITGQAKSADKIIAVTRFISHPHEDMLRKHAKPAAFMRTSGGLGAVMTLLDRLKPQAAQSA
jgi:hypothetical protein